MDKLEAMRWTHAAVDDGPHTVPAAASADKPPGRFWTQISSLILLILNLAMHTPTTSHANSTPFVPGEKLEYELRWENVPAGTAFLEVLPHTTVNGESARHFAMTVRTNRFVDLFYKVRTRIDAYADMDMTRSLHYRKKQHEGRRKRDEIVEFQWPESRARYSNFGVENEPLALLEGSFDPLSAFYFTRAKPFKTGSQIQRPVTDGKKNVIGRLTVHTRETITLQSGRQYDTYRVEPEMHHVGGVFQKSPDARIEIWITADERRIPVRIRSKVIVGHFIGELVSAQGLQ
jgi:hypothetical protein